MTATMYPSYPAFTRAQYSDLAIQFAVPNQHVVEQILSDSEQNDNLRVKVAAQVLRGQVSSLARLLRRRRVKIRPFRYNQTAVTLFLPPPPCPEPNTRLSRRSCKFVPQLAMIHEDNGENQDLDASDGTKWITMYDYMPRRKETPWSHLKA